jgi:hypothetical protein
MGPRFGLDTVEKRKILLLTGIEFRPSFPQPVATPPELLKKIIIKVLVLMSLSSFAVKWVHDKFKGTIIFLLVLAGSLANCGP